jgi:hypothetical protein
VEEPPARPSSGIQSALRARGSFREIGAGPVERAVEKLGHLGERDDFLQTCAHLTRPPIDPDGVRRGVLSIAFLDDSTPYTAGDGGVRRWNLETGANELLMPHANLARASSPCSGQVFDATPDDAESSIG